MVYRKKYIPFWNRWSKRPIHTVNSYTLSVKRDKEITVRFKIFLILMVACKLLNCSCKHNELHQLSM